MKLELTKEIKPSVDDESGVKIWYWVVVDGSRGSGASKPFHKQEDAYRYYKALKAFYEANGTFESVSETILSETIETPTNEPA
jgi:hypothetical protein